MPSGFELSIDFSAAGNSLGYLGGGWARAEDSFTWAVGQESHLLLPLGRDPREYILILRVVPFVLSGVLRTQRLIVSIDETIIGTATLSRPAVLAWRIPLGLVRRQDRTLVTLVHPDSTRP